MKKTARLFLLITLGAFLGLSLTGCEFTPDSFGSGWNVFMIVLGIAAGGLLLFFIGYAVVSGIYKGKDVSAKIVKKVESKVLRGNTYGGRGSPGYGGQTLSRKARRQKERIRYSKVIIELEGERKTLKCNDFAILDKLSVGKTQRIRIKFGEIVKVLK